MDSVEEMTTDSESLISIPMPQSYSMAIQEKQILELESNEKEVEPTLLGFLDSRKFLFLYTLVSLVAISNYRRFINAFVDW